MFSVVLILETVTDVVPVDPRTADQWIQPPYSGYFDGKQPHLHAKRFVLDHAARRAGEWIWGRGSCDDKSGLIASLWVFRFGASILSEAYMCRI